MLETVVECLVKRKITLKAYAGRCAMLFLDALALVATYIIAAQVPFLMVVAFLLIVVCVAFTYMVFRITDVEYEYSFFDGEMSVDKVMHKSSRKRLHRFDFGKMDYMAPEGSPHLGGMNSQRKLYDYSANDENFKSYVAVLYDENNNAVELKFTPNEELLDRLKKTYPRKIYED